MIDRIFTKERKTNNWKIEVVLLITKWNFCFVYFLSASSESEVENLEAQPSLLSARKKSSPLPENRFLMRKSPPKADEKKGRTGREREREREWYVNMCLFYKEPFILYHRTFLF